ncbi:acetyltransferase (GNAT) family protein [Pseudonocardia kunmingensis]|uniref:Acetyltransferase (GNAT) family protein n=1 Tax=Pseudonocardia kunmingensis TaxID=630975 RepID=A0A543DXW6_9PSEU|nr:acetyltransferase (GNAT) family protein [Pseudonocardia kunmingensis]
MSSTALSALHVKSGAPERDSRRRTWCDGRVTRAPARQLVQLGPDDLADRLTEALHVYVAAMGYPPSTARHRRTLWLEHVQRPGWRAVGWVDAADTLLGIAYGYTGGPGQWWYQEVRRGLLPAGPDAQLWLHDYFELTELHVRPDAQGHGLGESLLRALLAGVPSSRVLLSTPEYGTDAPGRAWRLYRRAGFQDVLRQHRFTGDARPFAVLGRHLPLETH